MMKKILLLIFVLLLLFLSSDIRTEAAEEPPALSNPLSKRREVDVREDTVPGYVEMSNGEVFPGLLYITRDKRLEIFDIELKRQRTIPITKIAKIECNVEKEWMEEFWRFKELASDEKLYTGEFYPCRKFTYTLTLDDGREIEAPMSGVIFVQKLEQDETSSVGHIPERDATRLYFHKRQAEKTDVGKKLADIHYTKLVKIGEDALKEGLKKAAAFDARKDKKTAKTPPAKIKQRDPNQKRAKI
ncbi:MAG: hypothetical protein LBP87_05935 [Planctomycetaceae bacterium]|jgi:hypothetical protein|nr:hypothetical protein [Planctomycetaceae bacterium]